LICMKCCHEARWGMSWFEHEWTFAEKVADLVTTNPFEPAWKQQERDLLGMETTDRDEAYSWKPGWGLWGSRSISAADIIGLGDRIDLVTEGVRQRLRAGEPGSARELEIYEILAMYRLYSVYGERFDLIIDS